MKTWDDVKLLYYKIAKQCSDRYLDFLRLYSLDDIVNEVWVRTYPYIQGSIKKLTFYIYQETKNVIHQFYRKQRRGIENNVQRSAEVKMLPIEEMDYADTEDNTIENIDVLQTVVSKLTLEERIILFLRFYCDWTEAAIGKALDKKNVVFQGVTYEIPTNVIKYRIKCILEKIRKEVAL